MKGMILMIRREPLPESWAPLILMKVPDDVKFITQELNKAGYAAYLVGGAVRDLLLGLEPKDWDVATNAPVDLMLEIFLGSKLVGASFGVVLWKGIQIAKFRQEEGYSDNRHPDEVRFVGTIEEDLERRDFTINAIAIGRDSSTDPFCQVFPESALKDLNAGIISAVGNANERFKEDALRMMRAARFTAKLKGFEIDDHTYYAMIYNAKLLQNISAERIQEELNKTLLSQNPVKGIDVMRHTHLLEYVIPEMQSCYGFPQNGWHRYDVFTHILKVLSYTAERSDSLTMRLAALFHDIGKPASLTIDEEGKRHFYGNRSDIPTHWDAGANITYKRLSELRYDKQTIKDVCTLVRNHMNINKDGLSPKAIRKRLNKVGYDMLINLVELKRADFKGSGTENDAEIDQFIDSLLAKVNQVAESNPPTSLRHLAVNGDDIIAAIGVKPGKWIGTVLSIMMDEVLDDPSKNTRDYLLQRAVEIYKSGE